MPLIFLRVPELVIGARGTENTIGNGFDDGYLGKNMANRTHDVIGELITLSPLVKIR